jgi:hypothetical protein
MESPGDLDVVQWDHEPRCGPAGRVPESRVVGARMPYIRAIQSFGRATRTWTSVLPS